LPLLLPDECTTFVFRRPSDTYYINKTHCLRAHTSAHQYQLLKEGLDAFLVCGDVYRRDEVDRTHYPCFHQLEGVRLFSPAELFKSENGSRIPILENGERTPEKQERHTLDAAKAVEIQLKTTLEGLSDALFGSSCEKRWVEAYFPFTHPSFELEVYYEDKWMEVLGCGIMEQKLLESAGVRDRVGWAFGLGLERLAMVLYGIPDIRLFWSQDSGFLSQFSGKSPTDEVKYKPISVHPQVLFDMSFFLPEGVVFNDMTANVNDTVRNVGGDLVEQVKLTDEFTNKKKNRRSQTYRIVYRSHSKALTKDEVNVVHKQITDQLVELYGVTMR
ncbi:phenylalanine--tRNA ligase, partial [Oesophagostomum dentatum]